MAHRIEKQFAGRTLVMETGRMARLADGAVFVQYGDTAVLVTAVAQRRRTHLPFFPLTVEYREKSYAAGKFPGGFIKREGRPGDKEVTSARQIDRPLRPLFPDGYMNETQIACFIVSADQENDADVLGLLGASTALMMSPIPWDGPIAGVRVGRVDGEWVINPTFQQLDYSDMDMVVAGSPESIVMVEGASVEVSEDDMLVALETAHEAIKELIDIQMELVNMMGGKPEVFEFESDDVDESFASAVESSADARVGDAYRIADKAEREATLAEIKADLQESLAEEYPDAIDDLSGVFKDIEKRTMRRRIIEDGVRVDGRGLDDIRDIACEVGILPRAHGSALFTRGQTQALVAITLGSVRDEQRIDSVDTAEETSKSFMLHYNFPPFSVGEAKPFRGPGRREIGHGMLAERALQPLLPVYDDFPYTIRVVSDILESNGSSSMASVCGGSLALMHAGVPMRAPCAGIAMGLIKEGDDVAVLTDILGVEDFLGDMDFKIAGTREGITAIQMDIKVRGLEISTMRDALQRARKARLHILDVMGETMSEAGQMSEWAPQIVSIQINTEKIGNLIGPKGKTIRAIQEDTGADINVEDDGTVTISAVGSESSRRAIEMVEALTAEPEIGRIYEGAVKNTTTFGAFVEILPGVEGLCHISELEDGRTEKTEDVVNTGDVVRVKLLSVDDRGRMKLSMRAAKEEEEGALAES
ncbi:MAG TPA: polyribonucleotide nucleotidyltransferase [Gemmatimonadota bacterium]|nr:polyribonucleotide nucleotidyltransferase [Gemmatimonadota bacterium]